MPLINRIPAQIAALFCSVLFLAGLDCEARAAGSPPAAEPSTSTPTPTPTPLRIGDSLIEIRFGTARRALSRARLSAWITASAEAVSRYYGAFPVKHLHVMLNSAPGRDISGTSYAGLEPVLIITLGEAASEDDLQSDWVMVHEMVHLAFPPVPRRHHWIEEGLATYIEPLARAEAGLLSVDKVWLWFVNGLPNGLLQPGDRGLDHTPTWGRTYWGGALFCLLADLEIRQRTDNRFALRDALRAIVTAGGTLATSELWPLARVLAIGDEAVGVPVLSEQYERMKAAPVAVDLDDLWRRLGVTAANQTVTYRDDAPLAWLRRALTAGPGIAAGENGAASFARAMRGGFKSTVFRHLTQ